MVDGLKWCVFFITCGFDCLILFIWVVVIWCLWALLARGECAEGSVTYPSHCTDHTLCSVLILLLFSSVFTYAYCLIQWLKQTNKKATKKKFVVSLFEQCCILNFWRLLNFSMFAWGIMTLVLEELGFQQLSASFCSPFRGFTVQVRVLWLWLVSIQSHR